MQMQMQMQLYILDMGVHGTLAGDELVLSGHQLSSQAPYVENSLSKPKLELSRPNPLVTKLKPLSRVWFRARPVP
jgi:hypothetical protein